MKLSAAMLRTDLLMLGGALAMTGAAVGVSLGPSMLDHGPTVQQQKQELESRKKEAATINVQLAAARANLQELDEKGAEISPLLPASQINDRLLGVTTIAGRSGITVAQMNAVPTDAKTQPETGEPRADAVSHVIPIKLSGKGAYPAVTRFLHMLHEELPDTSVIGIHLEATPDERDPETSTGSFTIELAWHAALADTAAPAAPSTKP